MGFNPSGGTIGGASDVAFSNPASYQFMLYDATIGKWVNSKVDPVPVTVASIAADYTVALADAGKIIEASSATTLTILIPTNTSVAFPVGTCIEIMQIGTGAVAVAGASGVTVRTPATSTTRAQWSSISIRKRLTNTWVVSGDLA